MNEQEYYVKLKYDVYIDEDKDEHSNYYDDSVWVLVPFYRGAVVFREL